MLKDLEQEVSILATDVPLVREAYKQYFCSVEPREPSVKRRVLNLLRGRKENVWSTFRDDWMMGLACNSRVSRVLVHFLNAAVRYSYVWKKISKPVYVFCHGYDVTWNMKSHALRNAHPENYVESVLNLPANVRFVANSQATRSRLESIGISKSRITINYLGVSVPELPKKHRVVDRVRILFLGRLVECKGPLEVIKAFELACKRGLKGVLIIAGDGPLREACEKAQRKSKFSNCIQLLGAVDRKEAERLRQSADIFTAHSQRGAVTNQEEAFGVSFAEAMAVGLPVVSGRSGGVPEIIRDGYEGTLVAPGDIDAHANAFLKLCDSEEIRSSMGLSGWNRAKAVFNEKNNRMNLLRILQS